MTTTDAASSNIAAQTASAGVWVIAGRLIARSIDIVVLLVLARLLEPNDFGLVAIAMALVFLVEAILELPLMQALIRVPEQTERMFSTAFTLGLLRGLVIAALMGSLAWPVSLFYEEPRLLTLLPAIGLAPIMRGLISPRMVVYVQRFNFRFEFLLDIIGKLVALVVAITIAYTMASYWAIVAGTIASPLAMAVISYIIAPFRIRLTLADWPLFRDMVGWNSAAQLVSALNWQMDRLLLGRVVDLTTFGRFAVANDLAAVPQQAVIQPLVRPLMAAFASVRTPEGLGRAYCQASGALLLIGMPILMCLGMLAGPIVRLVLGPTWDEATHYLTLLCFTGTVMLPMGAMPPLAMLLDKTRFLTFRMTLEFVIKLPTMIAGVLLYGIHGAIAARFLTGVLALVATFLIVRHLVEASLRHQLAALWRPLVGAAGLIAFLRWFSPFLAELQTPVALAAGIAAGAGTATLIYGFLVLATWKLAGEPAGLEAFSVRFIKRKAADFF